MYCQIKYTQENGKPGYISNGTFTIYDENCTALILVAAKDGTEIENVKIGCMFNVGSVALPFSEYTDVAVVKDN